VWQGKLYESRLKKKPNLRSESTTGARFAVDRELFCVDLEFAEFAFGIWP
jgi:hypothetical protein